MKFDLYDFDGTIYDGDSGFDLFLFGIKKYPKHTLKIPIIIFFCVLYIFKLSTKDKVKSLIFSFVKYIDNIDDFVYEFWNHYEHKLKQFWLDKQSHNRDIIISASGSFWLEYIKKKYKVHDLICTEYDITTGKIIGPNCHGKTKVDLFYKKYPKGIINSMYTDSKNDFPLISCASHRYLVKKDKIYNYFETSKNIFVKFWDFGLYVYRKNEEIWNYLIIGGLTTIIAVGTKLWLLKSIFDQTIGLDLQLAEIISWSLAVLFAFFANKLVVFKTKCINFIKEMLLFVSGRVFTQLIQMLIMFLFVTLLKFNSDFWVLVFTIICQVMQIVLNYFISKFVVFKKQK